MIRCLPLITFLTLCIAASPLFAADEQTPDVQELEVQIERVEQEEQEEQELRVIVAEAYIEIRTGPGRGYPVFYVVERGHKMEILKQRTDWYKVRTIHRNINGDNEEFNERYANKEGWAHADDIAKVLDLNRDPIGLSYPQFSDFTQRSAELGIMVGSFGGTDEITAYGGYHFTNNLSVELALSESFGDFSNGKAVNLNLVHQPFPEWRYSPFFTLGGGVRQTDPKSNIVATEDRTDDMLNVGVGVRTYLTRRLILRLQYKKHTVLTSRDDDEEVEEWKLGLSTFF